jgi:hypothetical protein
LVGDPSFPDGNEVHSRDAAGNVDVVPIVPDFDFEESGPFRIRGCRDAKVQGSFDITQMFPG